MTEPEGPESCRAPETPSPEPAAESAPRPPRLGAVASGTLSLLFVSGLVFMPFPGLIVAPLGLIPVARFLADGRPGFRAWGWVVVALALIGGAGFWTYAAPVLLAYALVIVIPALSLEGWLRWRWGDGRWAGLTMAAETVVVLVVVAVVMWPDDPVSGMAPLLRSVTEQMEELYRSAGVSGGTVGLAMDEVETLGAWIVPSVSSLPYLVAVLFWIRSRLPLLGFSIVVEPFERYRSEEWLPAAFAVTGLGTLFLQGTPRWVAANTLIAVLILYFVHGLAIIRAHLARWLGRGWFVRWGVVLFCLPFPFPFLVAGIGLVDSFVDLRPRADHGGSE